MKAKRADLSRRYNAALKTYLKESPGADLEPARELGHSAIELGLDTLDIARMHEIALVALLMPDAAASETKSSADTPSCHGLGQQCYSLGTRNNLVGRAGIFFAEAITPIEQTHRGAREANSNLNQMIKALSQQTLELAASNEELRREIEQRKAVEESLRTSEQTSSLLLEKSRKLQEELRSLSRKLLSVQEEERRRISRELHDVIAQTLTGINVRLATLNSESEASTKDLHEKIASTQRLVEESVEIVHRFARELRPTMLDDLGLIPALESFIKGFMEETGIRVSLKSFAAVEKSDSDLRTVLYRIAQEALKNVSRHAQASRASVNIENGNGTIIMEITDDGNGFEVDGTARAKGGHGLGLLGMRERVEMVGGTFCIESAPGQHTTVRVEIPRLEAGGAHPAPTLSKPSTTLDCP